MSIVNGCKFGVAQRGSAPRQCMATVVATITVSAKAGQRHKLEVCTEHYSHMATVRRGTEYAEVAGTPVPLPVTLVSLT